MAEDSDLERTEQPSQRRIEQAREDGDVPRSRELATCTVLLAAGAGFWFVSGGVVREIDSLMVSSFSFERAAIYDPNLWYSQFGSHVVQLLLACMPFALLLMVTAMASPLLIGGWLFSVNALQPNFTKLNPISGISNMFSVRALVELLKAIAKAGLVGVVSWLVISHQINAVMGLTVETLQDGSAHAIHILLVSFISIVGSLIVIAMIDAPYQMWQYANKLKMTRQELRQESKESDGNPEIKARIRGLQREMARRRMMAAIPTADVVVTNPTHFAVALQYKGGSRGAPRVVAKGADEVAAKIREIATAHKVPMLEAPALARALHRHTELGDEIPQSLYTAVAEVLAYVFQLRTYSQHGGVRPEAPTELDVPPELDPLNPASRAAAQAAVQLQTT
ncbi:MAG: flagellar type III secretion system protein FlhB [Burkholderiaceae bacterium]|nr:flagellar type III secretion system protein FlhB [Burkholderiaceae bacterium]